MENVQENPIKQMKTPVYLQQSKDSSMSMTAVILIFVCIFTVMILVIGSILYFYIGNKLRHVGNEVSVERNSYQITPKPTKKDSQNVLENKNQYYIDITETKNLWSSGRYQEALDKVNNALPNAVTKEDKAVAHYWIGLINYKQQNSKIAETELKLSLELFPTYAAPNVTLSAIEMDKGDFQKALEYAQKCVLFDPKYAWCHNNIGLSLIYLGKKEEGIKELEQAVSLAPDSYVFRDNLNRVRQSIE